METGTGACFEWIYPLPTLWRGTVQRLGSESEQGGERPWQGRSYYIPRATGLVGVCVVWFRFRIERVVLCMKKQLDQGSGLDATQPHVMSGACVFGSQGVQCEVCLGLRLCSLGFV